MSGNSRLRALHLAFFLSGAAGLIYQSAWIRQFGGVFGNTVHSASLVVAVFMAGLGAGSWVLGRRSDRSSGGAALLKLYVAVEVGIAVLGVGLCFLIPSLGDLSAATWTTAPGADGWFRPTSTAMILRLLIAAAVLFPSAFLMGGTLTVLIRFVLLNRLDRAGAGVGGLYGTNTAGAAVGALLTDQVLVPEFGLTAAQLLACLLNLCAALVVLRLAKHLPDEPVQATAAQKVDASPSGSMIPTVLTMAAVGFAGMAMELIWFRHLVCGLGNMRPVVSLILAAILIGIWLGAWAGGALVQRWTEPRALLAIAELCFIGCALLGLAMNDSSVTAPTSEGVPGYNDLSPLIAGLLDIWDTSIPILREVLLPAFFMGFGFPLANAIVQDTAEKVGVRAGLLYLGNTVGAVLGSLITGFYLIPHHGMKSGVTVVIAVVFFGMLGLATTGRGQTSSRALSIVRGAVVATAALGLGWAALPADFLLTRIQLGITSGSTVLALKEGINEIIAVVSMTDGSRWLMTNGHPMSCNEPLNQRYMRALAHLPLLAMDDPQRVAVVCFGVGNTAHAASLHTRVKEIDLVDISEDILAEARWFEESNRGVLRDPKLRVHVEDGRQFLRTAPDSTYDLVTLEPPPLAAAGVASLYSEEFYALVRPKLRPGGYLTQWLPMYQLEEEGYRNAIRAFINVFPASILISGSKGELILVGYNGDQQEIDLAKVEANLAREDAARVDLERIGLASLVEIVGTFVAGPKVLEAATAMSLPVTDDRPLTEYARRSLRRKPGFPAEVFDPRELNAWCPACYPGGTPHPKLAQLGTYLGILGRLYRSPTFLGKPGPTFVVSDRPKYRSVIEGSLYMRRIFGVPTSTIASPPTSD